MKVDLVGRIKNTELRPTKALLPMFEAVVNSFQAIEDALTKDRVVSPKIDITVVREDGIDELEIDGPVSGFEITDNGIGFTDENFESFFTSDSQYKVRRGGKGIGRFMWLKAFESAEIVSHFSDDHGTLWRRTFSFTKSSGEPDRSRSRSPESGRWTTVRLTRMLQPYRDQCPQDLDVIAHRLVEHCLPLFLDTQCPSVTVRDATAAISLNEYFRESFAAKASTHQFEVGGEPFTLKGLRLKNPTESQHRLLYAANSREVVQERLDKLLPNLQKNLLDADGEPFAYLGFVEGDYLNDHVNQERTAFLVPAEPAEMDAALGDLSMAAVREGALACVTTDLKPFLDDINRQKRAVVTAYIAQEAPEYRPLVRYLDEFIDRIPPGTRGSSLEMALHEVRYTKQRELKRESRELMEASEKAALRPAEYEEKLNSFLERANEMGKSSLAQYVAHRKVILEFLEKSLQPDAVSKAHALEETIHRIIYPMRTTSEDVPYDQQNLWIIDERLSYHAYLASDISLDQTTFASIDSRSRPDLMIFDRALSFAEDEATPLTSLVVVEFKRPDRAEFGDEDPIEQVYRLIRQIRSGHYKDKNGREIKLQSSQVPAYAYVICDTTKEMERVAEDKALMSSPDNLGFFGYNPKLLTYVEVISYDKLLRDAKRRNRVLFDKLNLPSK